MTKSKEQKEYKEADTGRVFDELVLEVTNPASEDWLLQYPTPPSNHVVLVEWMA